jgi:predicted MFS family arabinose efflux permease
VRITARWDGRAVIMGALVAFAAGGAVVALADSYAAAVAGRLVGAAACGLLWSTVNVRTAELVGERDLARAVSVVLGGATLGTVVGVPLAAIVARAWDWRVAFGALAVLALVAAGLVRAVVPAGARDADSAGGAGSVSPAGGRPQVRPLVTVTVLVGVVLVGHFATYTYVTRLLESPGSAVPGGIGTLLLVFGAASAAGVLVAGRVGDRWPAASLIATVGATVVALLAVPAVQAHAGVAVAVVVWWGLATGALPPLAQTTILRLAGPGLRSVAGMLIPVVFNLGIAVGAGAGSLVVAAAGPWALPVPSAALVAVAAVALGVTRAGRSPRSPWVAQTGR